MCVFDFVRRLRVHQRESQLSMKRDWQGRVNLCTSVERLGREFVQVRDRFSCIAEPVLDKAALLSIEFEIRHGWHGPSTLLIDVLDSSTLPRLALQPPDHYPLNIGED
jgi:hypothetical protein